MQTVTQDRLKERKKQKESRDRQQKANNFT